MADIGITVRFSVDTSQLERAISNLRSFSEELSKLRQSFSALTIGTQQYIRQMRVQVETTQPFLGMLRETDRRFVTVSNRVLATSRHFQEALLAIRRYEVAQDRLQEAVELTTRAFLLSIRGGEEYKETIRRLDGIAEGLGRQVERLSLRFGSWMRQLVQAGITQESYIVAIQTGLEAHRRYGRHIQYITSMYESMRGASLLSTEALRAYAGALGVPVDWLRRMSETILVVNRALIEQTWILHMLGIVLQQILQGHHTF